MIRDRIKATFPWHLANCLTTRNTIYVADYTEQTKRRKKKKGVILFDGIPPEDIHCFILKNPNLVELDGIAFNNKSFVKADGNVDSQCECVIYPHTSDKHSWICFVELKYSYKPKNNTTNLSKACAQLFHTQAHYRSHGVFGTGNPCYLLAALPEQYPPFANFSLSPSYLLQLKRRYNITLRISNSAKIVNERVIIGI